jgi:lipopolysaccharide biosynthesis glycosyltransferase
MMGADAPAAVHVLFSTDRSMLHSLTAALVSLRDSSIVPAPPQAFSPVPSPPVQHVTVCVPAGDIAVTQRAVRCALSEGGSSRHTAMRMRYVPFDEASLRGFPLRRRLLNVSDAYLSQKRNLSVPSNFARFYLPELLPPGVRYVLYSDVDVIFTCNVFALARTLPQLFAQHPHATIAAVDRKAAKNTAMHHFVNMQSRAARRMIDKWSWHPAARTTIGSFNAGFFAADVIRWREHNATAELIDLLWQEVHAIESRLPHDAMPWMPTKVSSQSPMLLLFYRHRRFIELDRSWNSASVGNRNIPVGKQEPFCLWHFSGGSSKPWCDRRPCPRGTGNGAASLDMNETLPKCLWARSARLGCVPSNLRPSPSSHACTKLDDRANLLGRGR